MSNSRTSNTVKNISVNLLLYGFSYVAVFVARTFFVKILGDDYLSISGLFANLITIISFSELGLGTASVYCLYKPLAEKKHIQVKAFLNYFRKLYYAVIAISLAVSILLVPFLPKIIDIDELTTSNSEILLIYGLFVINTLCSYLLIQSKLLLIADQKNYVVNLIQQIIHVSQLVLQTLYLIYYKDYIGYLFLQICCTLLTNCAIDFFVRRKYSYIVGIEATDISDKEKKDVKTNIISIFFYKIGAVILNGTDNIIISLFLKTLLVGIVSNFTLVINAINSVLMQCFNGIGASIGNHLVLTDKNEQESIFRQLNLLCILLFSVFSICLSVLLNPLINLWFGQKYLLDDLSVLALVGVFFITGANQIPSLYRTSYGLFKKARFYPIIASVTNIILSVVLARLIGLAGVFIATIIVRFVFFTIVDSLLIYKYGFEKSPINYFIRFLIQIFLLFSGFWLSRYLSNFVIAVDLSHLILKVLICGFVSLLYLLLIYCFYSDFRLLLVRSKKIIYDKISRKSC